MKLNIGETVSRARRELGMTQQQLADRLGISVAAVSKWETGASYPDITLLSPLAAILHVGLEDLLAWDRRLTEADIERLSLDMTDNIRRDPEAGLDYCRALLAQYPESAALAFRAGMLMCSAASAFAADEEKYQAVYREGMALIRANRDPNSPEAEATRLMEVVQLFITRDPDKALELLDTLPQSMHGAEMMRTAIYTVLERYDEAIETAQRSFFSSMNLALNAMCSLSGLLQQTGRAEEGEQLLHQALSVQRATAFPGFDATIQLYLADIYARRGDVSEALCALGAVVEAYGELGTFPGTCLYDALDLKPSVSAQVVDPYKGLLLSVTEGGQFDGLKDEPEFQAIVRDIEARIGRE